MATIKKKSRNPHKLERTACAVKIGKRKRRIYTGTQASNSSFNDNEIRDYLCGLPSAELWLDNKAKVAVERGLEEAK